MQQPKCHSPCEECRLPLKDQTHPKKMTLASGEGRRKGVYSIEGTHNG